MDELVQKALDELQLDQDHWNPIYDKSREDLHFLSDDKYAQWNQKDFDARESTGRPALTVDQTTQFIHQVANDIRQNTPTFNIIPDDAESSEDSAEAFRAIIRGIEYKSNADDVYDTASLNAVKCGIGFIRIDHDYSSEVGFEQDLCIKRVVNPFSCFIDKDSIECDGRDAKRGVILDKMKVSAFKKKYPKFDPVSFVPNSRNMKCEKDDDIIQIAERFEVVEEEKTIAMDSAGNVFEWQDGMPFDAKRSIKKSRVKHVKMSGQDVLEETWFPGQYIPLIPVYGEEHWVDGERNLFSLIRKAKGAQKMFNIWASLETEILLKQPIAPVMAPEGAIEQYAEDWKNPSKSMALRYKTKGADGEPLPPPQRLEPPTMPTGIMNARREALDDIKASMGLYNAAIGQRSNETSGVAIKQRQQEGDVATFHFYDNLVRSITHVYRVLISAIPEVYDTPRIIRAVGKEEEPVSIGVNGMAVEGESYDLTRGKYMVRVVPGASFTTKRQEAAAFYTEIVKQQPELMQIMGDLLFKYSDVAGAEAMAERMKKIVDPKFLEDGEGPAPDPEKQQMQQIIEQGAQELQALQAELETKDSKAQLDKAQADLKAQAEKLSAQEQIAKLTIENMKKDLLLAELQAQQEIKEQADALMSQQAPQMEPEGNVIRYDASGNRI